MCGRFVQLPLFDKSQAPWPELADDLAGVSAKYNLAPTQRAAVVLGATGWNEKPAWGMRQQTLSPYYTTRFADLPNAWC